MTGVPVGYTPIPAPIPVQVGQAALTQQLGEHRWTFPRAKGARPLIGLGILFGLSFLFTIVCFVGVSGDAEPDYSPMWIVGGICALLGVGFFWMLARSPLLSSRAKEMAIYCFEHGFVQVTRQGPQPHRWDSVRSIYQAITTTRVNGISTGTNYEYRLQFADGSNTKMTNMTADMAKLGPVLQREIARVQVPRAIAHMRAGNPIVFGDFTVTLAGIATKRKEQVPWNVIEKVEVFNGQVRLARQGKWLAFSNTAASSIPNLYTFLSITEELVAANRGVAPM